MACQRCFTSFNSAFERLNLGLLKKPYYESSSKLGDSLPDLYQSVTEGCRICQQAWKLMLLSVEYGLLKPMDEITEHEHDLVEDSSSTKYEDRTAAEFDYMTKALRSKYMFVNVRDRGSSSSIYMRYEGEGLNIVLSCCEFKTDILLWPAYKAVSDASNQAITAGASILPIQDPSLWSRWYRTCSELHRKCRGSDSISKQFTPDRLVEVSMNQGDNSFTWKLAHRSDIGNVQYLTLSHCWGSTSHTSLTSSNYTAFKCPNHESILPKTFRHALSITFSLGFKYIWIDSLCIIQDDPQDWKTQASMMGSVYENSSCNIAAAWAVNGDDGCFAARESRPITLKVGTGQPLDYHVIPQKVYGDEVTKAPLNARGWVTQERYLAKRQLSFAKSQVYWECREIVASEQLPTANAHMFPPGKPTLDCTTEKDRRQAWNELIEFYSECEFSRLSDRMIALAGLAEKVRNAFDDVYLAGLWKKDLEKQLCWHTENEGRQKVNRSRTPTYMAPTWSWASIDAPVRRDVDVLGDDYCNYTYLIKIIDVSADTEHSSKLHSFVASKLDLQGMAIIARVMPDEYGWKLQYTNHNDAYEASKSVIVIWDENMSDSAVDPDRWGSFVEERKSELLCMFVYVNIQRSGCNHTAVGLLLRRLPSTAGEVVYVRMGIFEDRSKILSTLLSSRLKPPVEMVPFEDIDLNDARLVDLVHTVTIV